jgi:hypothetical protein
MEKFAALSAYARFMKTATAAGKVLDSGKGSDLPPELRGAGVGALSGGIPLAALGFMLGGGKGKARLLDALRVGGAGAVGGGILGAGAGAIGRAATDPEDDDRLTGGSPVARGALLGGTALGGAGAALGGALGHHGATHRIRPGFRSIMPDIQTINPGLAKRLLGIGRGGALGGLPAAAIGGGIGAGVGGLKKLLSGRQAQGEAAAESITPEMLAKFREHPFTVHQR